MLKAKKYDWKDSNMALFGSDTDKQVKKESAKSEPAWETADPNSVGTVIWRIVKFKVTHVDEDDYGKFYNGDSYIILNKYKDDGGHEIKYDVHFWIGKYSTQDEYGTAAYKTVELDTFLDDKPVQHREVEGHESTLFKTYFETFQLLKGGADTGFKRVLPEEYIPRLFKIAKSTTKKIESEQIAFKRGNLNSEDCFVIDKGHHVIVFHGESCSHDEKFKAVQMANRLKSSRGGKVRVEIMEEKKASPERLENILPEGESKKKGPSPKGERIMFKVSDEDGSLDMDEIAKGDNISKDLLTSDDVFVINTGSHCYCWIGEGASVDERRNGLAYATNYLNKTETPCLPITVVAQGKESKEFLEAF